MFRIFSLDGGGIKETFSAAALAALEEATGKRCVEHFDLITGTSTGGIIAIGLGLELSAREIVEFYEEHGPDIFPHMSLVQRALGGLRQALWGPKLSGAVAGGDATDYRPTCLMRREFDRMSSPLAL